MPRKKSGNAKSGHPGRSRPGRTAPPGLPARESFTLTDLDQVRTLSHPLRVRILEVLCHAERTTKQVAEELGERPTRLYHHVNALERAGLIRLVRTRQNRGTVEKYYQAVAKSFRTDQRLFSSGPRAGAPRALRQMLSTVFDNTALEMQKLISAEKGGDCLEEEGILSYVEIQGGERRIQSLRRKLEKLIHETAAGDSHGSGGAGRRRYRLTLAFFPLDRGTRRD